MLPGMSNPPLGPDDSSRHVFSIRRVICLFQSATKRCDNRSKRAVKSSHPVLQCRSLNIAAHRVCWSPAETRRRKCTVRLIDSSEEFQLRCLHQQALLVCRSPSPHSSRKNDIAQGHGGQYFVYLPSAPQSLSVYRITGRFRIMGPPLIDQRHLLADITSLR